MVGPQIQCYSPGRGLTRGTGSSSEDHKSKNLRSSIQAVHFSVYSVLYICIYVVFFIVFLASFYCDIGSKLMMIDFILSNQTHRHAVARM